MGVGPTRQVTSSSSSSSSSSPNSFLLELPLPHLLFTDCSGFTTSITLIVTEPGDYRLAPTPLAIRTSISPVPPPVRLPHHHLASRFATPGSAAAVTRHPSEDREIFSSKTSALVGMKKTLVISSSSSSSFANGQSGQIWFGSALVWSGVQVRAQVKRGGWCLGRICCCSRHSGAVTAPESEASAWATFLAMAANSTIPCSVAARSTLSIPTPALPTTLSHPLDDSGTSRVTLVSRTIKASTSKILAHSSSGERL